MLRDALSARVQLASGVFHEDLSAARRDTEVARFRADYEALLAGAPDLSRYAARYRATAWEGAGGLAGRFQRLGELQAFDLLRDATLDGERALLFRARHANGAIYIRFSLDPGGAISRAVWWHV